MIGSSITSIPPLIDVEINSCMNFLFLSIEPRLATSQPLNLGLVPFDFLLYLSVSFFFLFVPLSCCNLFMHSLPFLLLIFHFQ
jgi:hypothetical protein